MIPFFRWPSATIHFWLRGQERSNFEHLFKFAVFSETVRDRAKRKILTLSGLLHLKFWIYRFLGHMTLKVTWPRKYKFAFISEIEIEQNRENFWPLQGYCMQNNKFWTFQFSGHMTIKVTWPWKCKFAVTSETIRDGTKQREFFTLAGLLHAK